MENDEYKSSNVRVIPVVGKESPFNNISSLIEYLRTNMFMIGTPSVDNLYSYLHGYAYAKVNSGEPDALQYLSKYNLWVIERYQTHSSQGWSKIISFYTMSESEGILLFWKLYDEFLEKEKDKGERKGVRTEWH